MPYCLSFFSLQWAFLKIDRVTKLFRINEVFETGLNQIESTLCIVFITYVFALASKKSKPKNNKTIPSYHSFIIISVLFKVVKKIVVQENNKRHEHFSEVPANYSTL